MTASRKRLVLYTRSGCHLCDEMKAVIDEAAARTPFDLEVVDIGERPELEELYGDEVPVLLIDGRKAAKYRVTSSELARKLAGPTLP
jgi:glutaredoxin